MTHEHKDGCCGSSNKDECKTSCCGPRGWVTGLAVVVAIGAVAWGMNAQNNAGMPTSKPNVDTSNLIKGEDTVVAKVNGSDVRKSDVAAAIREMGAQVPAENMDQVIPAFTEQYINLRLLGDAAEKEGVAKEDEVKAQLVAAREQIVRAAYLRNLFDGKVTEDTLKAAYKAKFEDQPMPEEVRARHILVETEDKAKELISQLNAGASFEKVAADNSKDPSAQRGGDLGFFTQTEMVKEFADAAFGMRNGQMTQAPVKTQFGYHIIKVEEKRTRKKPTFEEAKVSLEQEARQVILDAKLAELRAAAKVEILNATAPAAGAAAPAPADASAPAAAPAPEAAPAPAPAPVQ